MWKKAICICSFLLLITTNVSAHVMNSQSVFEDIQYSEEAEDILLISALGMVTAESGKQSFRPQDPLTRKELGEFIGRYVGFEGELAQQALEKGYLSSTKGEATYADVNQAFFENELSIENPEGTMTREEFAQFIAANLATDIGGQTLAERSGGAPGPTGEIEKVQQVEESFELTINGKVYELGEHPYAAAESVDPLVWQGMSLTKSWAGPSGKNALQFLKIESEPIKQTPDKAEEASGLNPFIVGIIAIVLVFMFFFLRRKKSNQKR